MGSAISIHFWPMGKSDNISLKGPSKRNCTKGGKVSNLRVDLRCCVVPGISPGEGEVILRGERGDLG